MRITSYVSGRVLNPFSRTITKPKERGAAQAMLYALGLKKNDLQKPQVGICSMWYEGNPCNAKLDVLSARVKESVNKKHLLPLQFNTIGVSDGMSMGTEGMKYSLPSRDLIADSIETVVSAQHYDALVCIPGCDKNLPGAAMALLRLNRPGCILYGGSMRPQYFGGDKLDIVSAFESYGKYIGGEINDTERELIVKHACDRSKCGSCAGLYTANTMAILLEVMGLSLPNDSSGSSLSDEKFMETDQMGDIMTNLVNKDIKPRDIATRESFLNAVKMLSIIGGSTNAIIHLLAMAQNADVQFTLEDVRSVDQIPVLLNMKPHGKYCMTDLGPLGGTAALCKYLIEQNILDGDTRTITGKTLWENVKTAPTLNVEVDGDDIIVHSLSKPFKKTSHINILRGNIAPNGCISKIYSEEKRHTGPAIVFDSETEMLQALENGKIRKDHFVILRYQGESVGCPEMLAPTSALIGYFGKDDVPAFATDGRFSGGSTGILVAHLPDAFKPNSPTALLRNNDQITVCLESGSIEAYAQDFEWRINPPMRSCSRQAPINRSTYLNRFCKYVGDIETGFTMQ